MAPGHLCKFKRILRNGKRTKEFACTHPHCNFTRQADYLVGKAASCAYCEKEFVISRRDLNKQGLLHCENCKKNTKQTITLGVLGEELDKIFDKKVKTA